MAIVKLKYTRSKEGIKRHLRYIVHRPGKDMKKPTRELFQHNYQSVTKQYAYDLINGAPKGTVFYKMTHQLPSPQRRYPKRFRFTAHHESDSP